MSIFRFVKYSSILFYLGKHRDKLFRSFAVLLFALVSSLLYEDLRVYLTEQHPETLIYALLVKILIVYGSLLFVLWQFRPRGGGSAKGEARAAAAAHEPSREDKKKTPNGDRLDALSDIKSHDQLRSRYERILAGDSSAGLGSAANRKPGQQPREKT